MLGKSALVATSPASTKASHVMRSLWLPPQKGSPGNYRFLMRPQGMCRKTRYAAADAEGDFCMTRSIHKCQRLGYWHQRGGARDTVAMPFLERVLARHCVRAVGRTLPWMSMRSSKWTRPASFSALVEILSIEDDDSHADHDLDHSCDC